MLFIDNKQVTPQEFCDRLKINFQSIKNNPVFELSKRYQKKDRVNNMTKVPSRVSLPTRMYVRGKDGETIELRYAESRRYKQLRDERVEDYTPRNFFLEAVKSRKENIDLAVYMYAVPFNRTSPFGDGRNYHYEHVDPVAIASMRLKSVNNVSKAMREIENMSDSDLVIFAKGLQAVHTTPDAATGRVFNPFPDGMNTHPDMVRVELMEFCKMNSEVVLNNLENKLSQLKGQIINLIDKGIIMEHSSQGARYWKWEKGERAGQPIGNHILDPHSNSREYVLNYICSNLAEYHSAIYTTTENLSADEQALAYLKNIKETEKQQKEERDFDNIPKSYAECQKWLGENGYSKAPKLAKQLTDAVELKQVHAANIHGFVKELIEAAKEDEFV